MAWKDIFNKAVDIVLNAPVTAQGYSERRSGAGVVTRRHTLTQNTTIIKNGRRSVVFTGDHPEVNGMTEQEALEIIESVASPKSG